MENKTQNIIKLLATSLFILAFLLGTKSSVAQTVIDSTKVASDTMLFASDSIPNDSINPEVKIVSKDAVNQSVQYSCSDSMMFDIKSQRMFLYGEGKIETDEMNLKAQRIEINTQSNLLFASAGPDSTGKSVGKPIFKDGGDEVAADTIIYNFVSKKGIVKHVITKEGDGFILSERSKIHNNKEVHIYEGKYTTCNLPHPHFYIRLTKAKVIPGEKIISGPMQFVIADIPLPLALPFGYIPSQDGRTSGVLIPQYGEEDRRGFFLRDGGYYWAVNPYLDMAGTFETYTQGSMGATYASNFKKRYQYSGNVKLKYIRNKFDEDIGTEFAETNSFWVTAMYAQDSKRNPTSDFSLNLNFGSSKHKQYNAVNINQFANNTSSSSVSYRKSFPGVPVLKLFNFSANLNGTQNTKTHIADMNLPNLTLSMGRQFPFKRKEAVGKAKWYEKIGVSFNAAAENRVTATDSLVFRQATLDKMRNGVRYSAPISTSFKLLKHINVAPSISTNGRIYTEYARQRAGLTEDSLGRFTEGIINDTVNSFVNPIDFSFSMPFSTKLYGMYNVNKFGIKAFRHVISPSVSLGWRPDFSQPSPIFGKEFGYYGATPYDTTGTKFYSYFQTGIYGGPPKGKYGAIGLSLGNNFEMKTASRDTSEQDKKIKLLESFNFSTSYNIALDSMNWSVINLSGGTRLFEKITVNFGATFDPYTVDTLGIRVNKYELKENRRVGRLTSARASIGGGFSAKDFEPKKTKAEKSKMELPEEIPFFGYRPEIPYADFSTPWDVRFNYNLNLTKQYNRDLQDFENSIRQSLTLNANLKLTANWKLSGRADYDLQQKEFTYTSVNIHRNLHCWEMSLNVVPFGQLRSYSFRINIKSAIFDGLEYKKRQSWHDNY